MRVRFAPSPTGYVHLGNIRAALFNYLLAKKTGGSFVLRIDDTDQERSKKEFVDAIKEDLTWIGIKWDCEFFQSQRNNLYIEATDKLKQIGRLYPCYETPEELEVQRRLQLSEGKPPVYNRASLQLTDTEKKKFEDSGIKPHWRFLLKDEMIEWNDLIYGKLSFHGTTVSDPVLIKPDGSFVYTLASVVDDIDLGITHVIRGADHIGNTSVQIQLLEALDKKKDELSFGHFPLIRTSTGQEMSKRTGSLDIRSLRNDGIEPMTINSFLAKLGSSDSIEPKSSILELAEEFDFKKLSLADAKFDPKELFDLNHKLLSMLNLSDISGSLDRIGIHNLSEDFWNIIKGNITTVKEIHEWQIVCFSKDLKTTAKKEDIEFLQQSLELIEQHKESTWKDIINVIKKKTCRSGKNLFMPLRMSITGHEHGPELPALLEIIGYEIVVERIKRVVQND